MMRKGFTLAELLIALAILGVIATFAIPKVLQAQQNNTKRVVFRETIASLDQIIYNGWITYEMTNPNVTVYVRDHLQHVKFCNNSALQGCWTHPGIETNEPGFILHNGVTLTGFNSWPFGTNRFIVDYNGPDGPNIDGEDQLTLKICYNYNGAMCSVSGVPSRRFKSPGIGPYDSVALALWDWIFSD